MNLERLPEKCIADPPPRYNFKTRGGVALRAKAGRCTGKRTSSMQAAVAEALGCWLLELSHFFIIVIVQSGRPPPAPAPGTSRLPRRCSARARGVRSSTPPPGPRAPGQVQQARSRLAVYSARIRVA